ncbi:hypothetical protein B5M09_006511 [Aphanomyces astaci]|uniref:Inward rectifier potassium channel C-terminal domain-containing protein n=1 Tax=Aphanomyces astaci TaxID=112090 RepID=A0A425CVJ9_APHAT|nr:hypothetical protein B5M09_006511 [Aphanomyces astaci]
MLSAATHFEAVGTWKDEWLGVSVLASQSDKKGVHDRYFHTTARSSFLDARHHILHNPRAAYKDLVYVLINISWTSFTVWILGISALITALFALVFHFVCVDTDVFEDAFNLSYQSFSTIGFGILYPRNTCGNLALSLEAFISMIIISAFSGLVFVRFSKPRSSAVFSQQCIIQPYGRHLALVIRVANATRCHDLHADSILEASFRVNLMRIEETSATDRTHVLRRYDLLMLQADFLAVRRDIQLVHLIDRSSPLYGVTGLTLAASDFAIQVDLVGVDATTQNTVQGQMLYSALQVEWGVKFQDMCMVEGDAGKEQWIMDFGRLSATVPAPIPVHPPTSPTTSSPLSHAPHTRQLAYAKSRQLSIKDLVAQSTAGDLRDDSLDMQQLGSPVRGSSHYVDMPPSVESAPLRFGRNSRHNPEHLTQSLLNHELSSVQDAATLRASIVSSSAAANVENAPHFDRIYPRQAPLPFSFHTFYTEALKTSWPKIIVYSFVAFVALNLLFAVVYYLEVDGVSVYDDILNNNTAFGVCLYYSVHTLSTVGYGAIGPKPSSTYQNFWIMVESTLGIVVITIFTGISVGVTEVNRHTNLRQVHDVELVNVTFPSINIPVTLVHIIDNRSPFAKFKTEDHFRDCNLQMLCLYSGIDHTFSTNVYARKAYKSEDFVVNEHFSDCAEFTPDGGVAIHYDRFHTHEMSMWS